MFANELYITLFEKVTLYSHRKLIANSNYFYDYDFNAQYIFNLYITIDSSNIN